MRPKKIVPTNDLHRSRLDQIIKRRHELVQLPGPNSRSGGAVGIREWWGGRRGPEHEKLLNQCEAKATELLAAMTAANAVAPNAALVTAIKGLSSFLGELSRLKISIKLNGKLRQIEADALVIHVRKLNEAAALFSRVNRGNA